MTDRFNFETAIYNRGVALVVGVDEVGRGPLAGPVVSAAVGFKKSINSDWWEQIKDSKKVSEKNRAVLASRILENGICGIGIASVEEIQSLNILQASLLAMKRAVENLSGRESEVLHLLVDGKFVIPDLHLEQTAVVKGDDLIHSIAAASILAKVTRDNLMKELDDEFPQYGFSKHKGYGTKIHIEAIRKYGLSPVHRVSFCGNIV